MRALRIGFAGLALLGLARTWDGGDTMDREPGMRRLGNDRTPDWSESPLDPQGAAPGPVGEGRERLRACPHAHRERAP